MRNLKHQFVASVLFHSWLWLRHRRRKRQTTKMFVHMFYTSMRCYRLHYMALQGRLAVGSTWKVLGRKSQVNGLHTDEK